MTFLYDHACTVEKLSLKLLPGFGSVTCGETWHYTEDECQTALHWDMKQCFFQTPTIRGTGKPGEVIRGSWGRKSPSGVQGRAPGGGGGGGLGAKPPPETGVCGRFPEAEQVLIIIKTCWLKFF